MKPINFQILCAAYLAYLSPKPCFEDRVRLHRRFFAGWTAHPTREQIEEWHEQHKHTKAYANMGMAFLRAMYNWGIRTKNPNTGTRYWLSANPATTITRHKTKSRKRCLFPHEVQRLMENRDLAGPKFSVFLLLLWTTACRRGEALAVKLEHLDLEHGVWRKPTTKNGDPQDLPLPRQTCAAITAYLPLRRDPSSPYLFQGLYGRPWSPSIVEKCWSQPQVRSEQGVKKIFPSFRQALQMPDVRIHDFRRTVASRIYAQTKDWKLVKAILNHSDTDVTDIYTRVPFEAQAQALQAHADSLFSLGEGRLGQGVQQPVSPPPEPKADHRDLGPDLARTA